MRKTGYFGIGIENIKFGVNYGTLFRTAQIFEADFLFLIGKRFKKQHSDTMKSWRHMPVYSYTDFNDFNEHRPFACKLIGIELDKKAIPIKDYKHPKQAIYLLGAEDHGLSKAAYKHCEDLIILPGEHSLNVSVAGSIVLYDRMAKTVKHTESPKP
jgi:tRNA G18 (ribose-2'-O)-methylase SpoU